MRSGVVFQNRVARSSLRSGRSCQRCAAAGAPVRDCATQANVFSCAPIVNGAWQLAGGHGREVFENVEEKLWAHAEAGLTTFDTADIYGPSERILGTFQSSWRHAGKPPVQILTKYVPNIFNRVPSPSDVRADIQKSLSNLQVASLDVVQLHWWDYGVPGMVDVALALADLKGEGVIGEVGLTNMNVAAMEQILSAGVPVVSNQVHFSLLDRRPVNGLLDYCQTKGIKLLAYGPLAGGLLSDKFVEEPKAGLFGQKKYSNVDLNTSSLKMYWNAVKRFGGQEQWRKLLQQLRRIADKHNCTVANVALSWLMAQGGGIVHPIVGVRGTAHIADNLAALDVKLDAGDLAAIDDYLAGCVRPYGDVYSVERGEM